MPAWTRRQQGRWRGTYGAGGYALAGVATSLPSFASIQLAGQSLSDLERGADARSRDGNARRGPSSGDLVQRLVATIDLRLTDDRPRQVALYLLDWDTTSRAQRIDVIDAVTGALLDSRDAAGFAGGHYLVWTIRGHVRLEVVRSGGLNAVVSGVFIGE